MKHNFAGTGKNAFRVRERYANTKGEWRVESWRLINTNSMCRINLSYLRKTRRRKARNFSGTLRIAGERKVFWCSDIFDWQSCGEICFGRRVQKREKCARIHCRIAFEEMFLLLEFLTMFVVIWVARHWTNWIFLWHFLMFKWDLATTVTKLKMHRVSRENRELPY